MADWLKTEFYFGLSIQVDNDSNDERKSSDLEVRPEDFSQFLAQEVTPRFPEGLTVVPARGQWQSPVKGSAPIQERSQIVLVYHPDTLEQRASILDVVEAYRERFRQEAVLFSSTNSHVCITATDCLSTQFFWNTTALVDGTNAEANQTAEEGCSGTRFDKTAHVPTSLALTVSVLVFALVHAHYQHHRLAKRVGAAEGALKALLAGRCGRRDSGDEAFLKAPAEKDVATKS